MLETSNFIVLEDGEGRFPLGFYQARDLAYEIGLLKGEGELQESIEEPSPDFIKSLFVRVSLEGMAADLK
jgi:hypothetical protein